MKNPLEYGKAIAGSVVTGLFTLTAFITGDETFKSVTTNEWLVTVVAMFASLGVTYYVPNKTPAAVMAEDKAGPEHRA